MTVTRRLHSVSLLVVLLLGTLAHGGDHRQRAMRVHVGHREGLTCLLFDGKSGYREAGFIRAPAPRSIVIDAKGVLHVAHSQGLSAVSHDKNRAAYRDASAENFYVHLDGLRSVALGVAGRVYVLGNREVTNYTFGVESGYVERNVESKSDVSFLFTTPDGAMHLAFAKGLEVRGQDYGGRSKDSVEIDNPVAVTQGSGGILHLVHASGLTALRYSSSALEYLPTSHHVKRDGATAVSTDTNGNVHVAWGSTLQVYKYDPSTGYEPGASVEVPLAKSLTIDDAGYIHVAHEGGVSAVRFRRDSRTYEDPSLSFALGDGSVAVVDATQNDEIPAVFRIHRETTQDSESSEQVQEYLVGGVEYREVLVGGRWIGRSWSGHGGGDRNAFEISVQKSPALPRQYLASGWTLGGDLTSSRDGQSLYYRVPLEHRSSGLAVKVHTRLDGTVIAARWLTLTNRAKHPVAIRDLAVWSGALWVEGDRFTLGHSLRDDNGHEGWFGWEDLPRGFSSFGQERGLGYDDPYFLVRNEKTGEYFFAQLAWPVNTTMEFFVDPERGGLAFRFGPWARAALRVLEPGESLTTPAVHMGLVRGDFDAAVQAMHEHVRRSVLPKRSLDLSFRIQCLAPEDRQSRFRGDRYNEENVTTMIDAAADGGGEVFIVDGPTWAAGFGNWVARTDWFPRGLSPVREFAHGRGVRFGLYAEPEGGRGDWTQTKAYREHPEWFAGRVLNLARSDAADYMEREWRAIVENHGIDVYRHDINVVFRGDGTVTKRAGFAESDHWRHYDALVAITGRMTERYPEVTFQQASGGGTRLDLSTVGVWHEHFSSDENRYPHVYRMAAGMSVFLPPEVLVTPNGMYAPHRAPDLITTLRGAYALGNTPQLFNELLPITPEERTPESLAPYQKYAKLYREFMRPLLSSTLVYHHHPVNASGSVESGGWFAMEFMSPDRSRGWAIIIRLSPKNLGSYQFQPRGLDPAKRYAVTRDNTAQTSRFVGLTLIRDGIRVEIPEDPASELLLFVAD